MDIFIIHSNITKNFTKDFLYGFQKKEISNSRVKDTHCLAYLMLDSILREYYKIENREIIFVEKKPVLKSGGKHFSISHSGDYIVLAFSDFNCGVDIEEVTERDYKKIAERMNFKSASLIEFYNDWTKFEAEYKMNSFTKSAKKIIFENYIVK